MVTDGRRWPFHVLTILVILAGAAVGATFGAPAGILYNPYAFSEAPRPPSTAYLDLAGFLFGASGGAGAGLFWSLAMRRLTGQAGRGAGRLIGLGGGLGIVAGAMATVFLHAGLVLFSGQWHNITNALTCQVLGVPAGLLTGLFCGFLAWVATALVRRKSVGPGPAPEP
jgi:MFS family permease